MRESPPTREQAIHHLQMLMELQEHRRQALKLGRCRAHRARLQGAAGAKPAFDFIRGERFSAIDILRDPQDSTKIAHELPEMHQLLRDAWQPLFQLTRSMAEPTWEAFREEYAQELLQCGPRPSHR